jgi:hypothetical protein
MIECASCYYGGACKHPLKKSTRSVNFCLDFNKLYQYSDKHQYYPNLRKVRSYYAYRCWKPKEKYNIDKHKDFLLTDRDFEL